MKCISWSQCFECFFSPWWCSPRPSLHTPPSPFSLLLTNGAQYASFEYSTSSPKSAEFDAFFPESEPIFSPLVTINARVITTPPHLTDEVVFWVMNIFWFFFSLFLKADFYLQVHWTFFQNSAGLFLGVFADCKLVCVFQSFWVLWWSSEVTAVKSGNMYAYIPENVPDLNGFSSPCKRFSAQPQEPAHLPAHGCFLGMNSTTDFDNPSAFHISLMYLCYLFFDLMFFHWRSHLFTYYIDKQLNLTLNDRSQIWAHSCTGNISI